MAIACPLCDTLVAQGNYRDHVDECPARLPAWPPPTRVVPTRTGGPP